MTDKPVDMHVDMMWFEESDDIFQTIANAAGHYYSKYGKVPERCHVNPSAFGDTPIKSPSNMKIVLDSKIRPNHVWVGVVRK